MVHDERRDASAASVRAVRIDQFTSDHVNRYVLARKAQRRATATINNELALLRHAFNLGAKASPAKVERPPRIPRSQVNSHAYRLL